MTGGYWTILYLIVYCILLLTGWREWLDKYIKLPYIVLFFGFILGLYRVQAITLELTDAMVVTIHPSIYLVMGLFVAAVLFRQVVESVRYVILSMILFSSTWALIKVLLQYSPSFEGMLVYWQLPILCGVLMACLTLTISQTCFVMISGAILGEFIVIWQQDGQYIGEIGTLSWWDILLNTLFIVVIIRFISYMVAKGLQFMTKLIIK